MKPRSYLTQCDSGGRLCTSFGPSQPCPNTIKLEKPASWRCDDCIRKYGKPKADSP